MHRTIATISEMADLLVIVNYIMVMEPINLATSENIASVQN
jgi:hypothetical protein